MREHGLLGLGVHLGLELVPVLERHGPLRRRPRAYLIHQTLQVPEFLPSAISEHGRNKPRPAPHIHVDDRIGVAENPMRL